MQRLKKERKREKKHLWAPSYQLPKRDYELWVNHLVISVHSEPLRLQQCSVPLGQDTNFFLRLFKEVENYEEKCKLKQSTVSSTGLQMGRPANILYKTLAPKRSWFKTSGTSHQCVAGIRKTPTSQNYEKI